MPAPHSPVEAFLVAIGNGDGRTAEDLLARHPDLPARDFRVACAVGDLARVTPALAGNPGLAVEPGGPLGLPALAYACFSPFLRRDEDTAGRIVEVARLLLDAGADPNTFWLTGPKESPWRLTVLYAAAGRANHAGLTRLLLQRGADPNDNESLYHSAEFRDHACTRLLLDFGARIPGTNAVHRKLDFDDLDGFRLFLDRGADPNLADHAGETLAHAVISRNRRVEFLALLAERGADLRRPNGIGRTPYHCASLGGHAEAAGFLARVGAATELTPREEFLAAAAAGDLGRAEALRNANPSLRTPITGHEAMILAHLAWLGRAEGIRALLALGWPVDSRGTSGETALHNACWIGHLAGVEALLAAGAPLDVVEPRFRATPLHWAIHGWKNSCTPEGTRLSADADHEAVIRRMVAAGANAAGRPEVLDELPEELRTLVLRSGH